jgi:6-methylsalicylate decarboxylase
LGPSQAARDLARALNIELGSYAQRNSSSAHRLDFFGTLPDWQDVNGTLREIDFLYKQQRRCQGVIVYTSYGGKLLGDTAYRPIWQKLQEHKALVLVHPSGLDVKLALVGGFLPQYAVDFLWSTTRAAIDLVVTGTMAASPDIDVILSHAGGAVPYVGTRALQSLLVPEVAAVAKVSVAQAQTDFARFYYDTALSASAAQLNGVMDFSSSSRLLFGTDYPFAPPALVEVVTGELTAFQSRDVRGANVSFDRLTRNGLALLEKHRQR